MAKTENDALAEANARIERLEAIVAEKNGGGNAVKELADQLLARQPQDPSHMGLSEEQRKKLSAPLTAHRFRLIQCKSEDTGATFDAHVVESANKIKFPHGRITRIENYRHPKNLYQYVDQGGLIPSGMPICAGGKTGLPSLNKDGEPTDELHAHFKQWRWEEFWKKDLKYHNGRAMKREFCADQDHGLDTQWETSSTNAILDPEDIGN